MEDADEAELHAAPESDPPAMETGDAECAVAAESGSDAKKTKTESTEGKTGLLKFCLHKVIEM